MICIFRVSLQRVHKGSFSGLYIRTLGRKVILKQS